MIYAADINRKFGEHKRNVNEMHKEKQSSQISLEKN